MTAREAVNLMRRRTSRSDTWFAMVERELGERMNEEAVYCATPQNVPVVWVNDSYDTCVQPGWDCFLDPRDFDNDTAEAVVRQIEAQGFHPGDLLAERFQETR